MKVEETALPGVKDGVKLDHWGGGKLVCNLRALFQIQTIMFLWTAGAGIDF